MIKIANNLQKLASKIKAKDISFGDPDHPGHVIVDYLYGMTGAAPLIGHASMRSDVAQTLAEAANVPSEDISWNLKHPILSPIAGILGGAGLGAGLGIGAGALANEAEAGGLIGAIAGGLGGGLLTTMSRRQAMKDIAAKFDEAKSLKKMTPENLGVLDSALKGLTGVHPSIRDMVINEINALKK